MTMRTPPGAETADCDEQPISDVDLHVFWNATVESLFLTLQCGRQGLQSSVAVERLDRFGRNSDSIETSIGLTRAVLRRLLEPLSLILLIAGVVSAVTGDAAGGAIIVAILTASIGLDTIQEGRANTAAAALRRSVAIKAEVKRDGTYREIEVECLVPGDLIRVRSGDVIPADAFILESDAFTADEAALTGEPFPVEKRAGAITASSPAEATNALFRGSVATTGEAIALVVSTGRSTVFGSVAASLLQAEAPSPFQRDLREFGLVTARLTLGLVLVVLATRVLIGRDVMDSLMFAVALAVGLTPELLPMITTVTLSRGAIRLARRKVIVKRLSAIHDLGAMTVLCTDKTGTLTSAEITLSRSVTISDTDDPDIARLGSIAAALGGDRGALDAAMIAAAVDASEGWTLEARRPFDFSRRLGSILARGPQGRLLIVKGAPEAIVALCSHKRNATETSPFSAEDRTSATNLVLAAARDGTRAIALATRPWNVATSTIDANAESQLTFEGLCTFADPPKATAAAAVARIAAAGIRLKILSGDDPVVVQKLAGLVGVPAATVLSGAEIEAMSDSALAIRVHSVDAYGRLAPDQKSRIIKALQRSGAVVGFLGDGINDAPALKIADIGLSVDGATGVAQAASDIILLESDLGVVADGVQEGRRTFANIMKYVRMGASSNFGNMLSMAVASVVLPFLPMLPIQILLNNLLYDLSEIGIPFDGVRPEATAQPQVWDMKGIIRFAAVMGPLSSLFDFLTFGVLLFVFKAAPPQFQTAWFVESMVTQILVVYLIRTNGRPWNDLPNQALVASTLAALFGALTLPFSFASGWFGFVPLPLSMLATIGVIVASYLISVEFLKPLVVSRQAARRPG